MILFHTSIRAVVLLKYPSYVSLPSLARKLKKSLSLSRHNKRKILQWQTRVSNQTEIYQRGFGELVGSIPIWRFQCSLSYSWENHWTCLKRTKALNMKRTTLEHYVRFGKTFHQHVYVQQSETHYSFIDFNCESGWVCKETLN